VQIPTTDQQLKIKECRQEAEPCACNTATIQCMAKQGQQGNNGNNLINISSIIIISIQPKGQFGQEPQPSQATGMALVCCILGKFLGVVCHCFPPCLDIPTFAARCLAAKGGTMGKNVVQ
jgi:hypothetical protein